MKLNFVSTSAAILLLATSSFAAPPAPPALGHPSAQHAAPEGQHAHPDHQGQTANSEPAPVKKKVDPKLQQKLDIKVDDVTEEEYQKIVGEYKQYLRDVPGLVRQEVRDYRKEIVKINKEKSALYKKLSLEAQKFLSKEREIKKKLPITNQAAFAKEIRHSEAE